MITSMTSANNKSYQNFFKNVSMLLRTHTAAGEPCEFGSPNAALESNFIQAEVSAETFEPNVYYIDDFENGGKKLATSYADGVTYYDAPENDITSLEEYFANIELIAQIKPIYTRLPLDEPLFEIDLNSRVVKIPQEFQKNGVGIQGDHIAESIYFAYPRFFDTTDLGNEEYNIFIQWENAEGLQRVSVPTIRDIESKPGYVIFDLPICDKITKKAGNVKVAIRFYRIDGDEIYFSLSTQPFSISIKTGLNFENFEQLIQDDELDDHKDLIRARFINSSSAGVEVEVDPPVFLFSLPNYHIVKEGENEKTIAADGDGIVSYSWKRRYLKPRGYDEEHPHGYTMDQIRDLYPLGDDPVLSDHGRDEEKAGILDLSFKGKTELVKIDSKNEIYNAKKDYYVQSENGYNIYVEDKAQFDEYKAQDRDIFEKKSFAIIDKVGEYYVVASNRKGSTKKTAESNVMTVEYPAKPVFTGSTNFNWSSKENYPDSHYCIIGDTANGHQKNHSVSAVAPEQIDDKGAKTSGELSFKWYAAPLTTMNFSRTAESPDTVFAPVVNGFNQSLSIEEEGYYRVLVTNTLNGETDSVTSGIIRATNPALKPVVSTSDSDNRIDVNSTITVIVDEEKLEPAEKRISSECEAKDIFGEDTLTYQWYRYTGSADDLEKGDEEKAAKGEFNLYAASKGEEMINETSASFKPQERGTYFCIVTNSYNGNKNSASSPMIYV